MRSHRRRRSDTQVKDEVLSPRLDIVILENEGPGAQVHLQESFGQRLRAKAEVFVEARLVAKSLAGAMGRIACTVSANADPAVGADG